MSREHTVSKAVLPEGDIWVDGAHWCPEPKLINIADFARKILCTEHNNRLSGLADVGAVEMQKSFREAQRLQDFRSKYRRQNWTRKQFVIPARKLERWFLKTLINFSYRGPKRIGRDASSTGEPSPELVEIAFGLRDFEQPAGLYTIAIVGDTTPIDNSFRFISLTGKHDYINAGIFHFGGLKTLLYLDDDTAPVATNFLGHKYPEILNAQFMYHLYSVKFELEGRLSHSVDFDWRE
jgi:hypothetical protein